MSNPPFGVWPPITSIGGTVATPALVLTAQLDRFLNADTGSDTNDGASANTPWQTMDPFAALLSTYSTIGNGGMIRLTVQASTAIADVPNLEIPQLVGTGKVVIRGTEVISMMTNDPDPPGPQPVSVTADAGSTINAVNVAIWPSASNPVGWQMLCTAGANAGRRRTVGAWTGSEGGPAVINPAGPLDAAGVGDTWTFVRPAAKLNWLDTSLMEGAGSSENAALGGDLPGVYIAQLQMQGSPYFTRVSVYVLAVEYFVDASHPGVGWYPVDDTTMSIGQVFAPMPWIDNGVEFWNGCGLSMRRETLTVHCNEFIYSYSLTGFPATINGFLVGTKLVALQAIVTVFGGQFYGHGDASADAETILVGSRSVVGMALSYSGLTIHVGSFAPTASLIHVTDANTILYLGDVTINGAGVLLRAEKRGQIIIVNDFTSPPSGTSSASDAQDATGGGEIYWPLQPALLAPAGAEIRVNASAVPNTALAAAHAVVASGISWIARW